MKLKMYLAQIKQGQYEASIPWIAQLAQPIRGPSPAQLKEELMFRALELLHEGIAPRDMDRLLPPANLQVVSVYVEVERRTEVARAPSTVSTVTHVIIGRWENDSIDHLWMPRMPGVCLALRSAEEVYAATSKWVSHWAERNLVEDLSSLECPYWGKIEEVEVDLGFPESIPSERAESMGKGRLRRPAALSQVATNLTHRADDDALSDAYGREEFVERLIEVMTSPKPVNICLVGPPGVGKSSIIYQAVKRVFTMQKLYQSRRDFWETSGDRIIAGMSVIGQWEQRVSTIVEELSERGDILVLQDLLGVVRAGRTYQGDSNVARFIEPALEQDRFSIIAEATEDAYAMARAMAPGFVDKFRRLHIPELGWKETLGVINELVRHIEGGHDTVRFTPDGVETVLGLTRRFFKQDAFPGKAVRLTKQCEMAALRRYHESPRDLEQVVDAGMVAEVFQQQTGLPRAILEPGTGRTPTEVREAFDRRIFAQPAAVDVVSGLVLTIEQGLTDPNKPLGSLLLVGPSGVGKTETAKALAEQLFGSDERMIRFDMSEFNTPMAISRLIGTPSRPDGELTGRVRLQPFCVVLLDEIEKAHGDVHDLLLQVLGDGRLTDAAGRTVDFRNAVLVMTSNLGAGSEDHWLGFHEKVRSDRFLHYKRSVEAFFRPEFFNRIDHIVPFNPLGHSALRRIARRTLRTLLERRGLRQAQLMVDVDEALIDYLIEGAVDPRYGARTLGRRIERALITPLASRLTTHQTEEGLTRVSVRVGDREEERIALDLQVIKRAPQQALAPSSPMTSEDKAAPQWVGEDGARTALDAQQLVDALHRVSAMLDSLEGRKEIRALSREYHSILEQFNDPEQQEDVLEEGELAERLRQREVVLKRLAVLRARLDSVLDPRGTGEYVFPIAQEIDRRKQRAWSSLVSQLEHELLWLEVQLRSLLTREADSATLVVTGLSGPFPPLLSLWLRVLRAIDEVFSLDLTMVELSGGKWRPLGEREDNRQAIAVSTEAPGLFALFDTLEGYAWSPRLPSHGQHALALLSNFDSGVVSQDELISMLEAGEFDTSKERGEEACIEFIEQRGQLEDVRLGRFLPIPEDRATNLQQFALRLVMPRVASSGAGVYGESMRSGMHRALTQEDLDGADTQ